MADLATAGGRATRRDVAAPRDRVTPRDRPAGSSYRRLWWIYLLAGLVLVLGYQALAPGIPADVLYVLIGLSGVTAIVVGVGLRRPARAGAWLVMAAGQLVWTCGDAVGSWLLDVRAVDVFPSAADAFYVAAYPVLAVGLYRLIRGRYAGRDLGSTLDTAIVTAGIALLSWVLLAGPALDTYRESLAAAFVALAYPLADIVLIGLLIRLIVTPGSTTPALLLLLSALVLLIAADSAALALDQLTFGDAAPINPIWLLSYVTWGAAALHPSMAALSVPGEAVGPQFGRGRLFALTVAVMIAPVTLAIEAGRGLAIDVWAIVTGSMVMFLLVVARMRLTIDQLFAINGQRDALQETLAHQAAHDALTGLPNRAQALQLIRAALSRAQRTGGPVGLLFIDLDGFKTINDTLGHGAGDEVLCVTSRRMEQTVRPGDVVARLGGDEFVVLLEPLGTDYGAAEVAERLVAAASEPVTLSSGRLVRVGASIGVAVSQDANVDPEVLLHEADVAVYRAKEAGRGRAEVYDRALRQEIQSRAELESDLRRAIGAGELALVYQHIVSLQFGGVEGYEAFVRWNRPGYGTRRPADFLPTAELSDLICELDRWVIDEATRQLAAWVADTPSHQVSVTVNVSGRTLRSPEVVPHVDAALARTGLRPSQLVLETPETALDDDLSLLSNLGELRGRGVRISVDDFGTGSSSIARLEHLPVDIVKIDKKFLAAEDRAAAKLLPLAVQAAHTFGRPVVAEGVEQMEQFDVLLGLGCEFAQGYFFGRPLPAEKLNLGLGRTTSLA